MFCIAACPAWEIGAKNFNRVAASAPACLPTEQKGMKLPFASIERIAS